MSRIGKKPIEIPTGVTVQIEKGRLVAQGQLGELSISIPTAISIAINNNIINVGRSDDLYFSKAMHGTIRNLTANIITGVSKGYTKELEIQGIGYKAQVQGQKLILNLGFSSPVEYKIPEGIKIDITDNVNIKVTGIDKQLVGNVSAIIRSFFPAEPYKGKGIRFKGEQVRRKAGKTVA